MTTYATRSPLQLLTNTHYMMAEQPPGNRRSSARLKVKEDLFATNGSEKSKQNGATKQTKSSAKAGNTTKLKRKIDYDEEDNGFKFTRSQPKRAKATPAVTQQIEAAELMEEKSLVRRKTRRKSQEPEDEAAEEQQEETTPRRSTRKAKLDPPDDRDSPPSLETQNAKKSPRKNARNQGQDMETRKQKSSEQTVPNEPTKIALPFADTPIIRRNKEMRKGNNEARRSSLSMRGRRASSLIDSGTSSALPHDQVETSDFYKHIESSLIEPRRMRQLLMWCGSRALGKKPSFATNDSETKLAAWQIQQELLKDFASKAELSDWFSREETSLQSKSLKPNPRNLANIAKIEELEQKIKILRTEQEQWATLQRPPETGTLASTPLPLIENLSLSSILSQNTLPLPLLPSATATATSSHSSSATVLTILQTLNPISSSEFTTSIQKRLTECKTTFELNLDKLLDSINSIGQHLHAAEDTSKDVLKRVATILEQNDRRLDDLGSEGAVGTMDALRALSRIVDRNGS